jgi:hypothetical protein
MHYIILHLVSIFFPPSFVWTQQIIIHFGTTTSINFGDIFVQLNTILLLLPSSNMIHTRFFVFYFFVKCCFIQLWCVLSMILGLISTCCHHFFHHLNLRLVSSCLFWEFFIHNLWRPLGSSKHNVFPFFI